MARRRRHLALLADRRRDVRPRRRRRRGQLSGGDALQPLRQAAAFFDVTEGGDGYCDGAPESSCGKPNTKYTRRSTAKARPPATPATGFDGPPGVGAPKGLYGLRADDFTAVTQTSVTLNSRVNPDGSNVTACKFEYGTTTGYGKDAECKALPGSGESRCSSPRPSPASRRTPNTTSGSPRPTAKARSQGPDIAFRTLPSRRPRSKRKAPPASARARRRSTRASTPAAGRVSTCKFEYGTTTGYGSSVSCAALPGSGSSPVAVDASIASGLAANTEYHYRISATNSSGTSKGRTLRSRRRRGRPGHGGGGGWRIPVARSRG